MKRERDNVYPVEAQDVGQRKDLRHRQDSYRALELPSLKAEQAGQSTSVTPESEVRGRTWKAKSEGPQ